MFGDDPDPTVMTERVGSGQVSDAREKGFCALCIETLVWQEGKMKNKLGLETVNESKGGHGNYERMQVLKNNDGNEVPMQCE